LAYVVVNSAAQSLSLSFNKHNLLALIPWANVASGFIVRGALQHTLHAGFCSPVHFEGFNAFFFPNLAYHYRIAATGTFGLDWFGLCTQC
jgi:hypothetical protein